MKFYTQKRKLNAFTMQELLGVLAIIGIIMLLALPSMMPTISKAKSIEAKVQLKFIYNIQMTYRFQYSKYTSDLYELDFEAPKTTLENGTSNYRYEIIEASSTSFKARATAVNDFDGDGVFNVWEINENGIPDQIEKD